MAIRASATWLVCLTALAVGAAPGPPEPPDVAHGADTSGAGSFATVVPGRALQFPADRGSHPGFRTEWWYVTGWVNTDSHQSLGFQITFFRTRPALQEPNPSAFAPHELLLAHCALSDPRLGRLWHDQRVRRAGFGLAGAAESETRVWIDDWRLERQDGRYHAQLDAGDFALSLTLIPTQPPLLNGAQGYSRKGPDPRDASYYYSEPHLSVEGTITRAGATAPVHGSAWLDHEWSSRYLSGAAVGWDWIGINLDDGGALMAFRLRDRRGGTVWTGATLRDAAGKVSSFEDGDVGFTPHRLWHSPRTGTGYPVTWTVRVGTHRLELEPLLDDQENDARLSSGAIYWEGAVTAREAGRTVGHGYLELTGYDRPLSLGR